MVQQGVDLGLGGVGVDVEVGVAGEHGRQLAFRLVVEDVTGDATGLGIGQLIAHAQRGARALPDEHVALAQPCRVLVIDARITLASLLHQVQVALADVLGEHHIGALDVGNQAAVQFSIDTPATNGTGKIDSLVSHDVMCYTLLATHGSGSPVLEEIEHLLLVVALALLEQA